MRLMETKEQLFSKNHVQVTLNIPVPAHLESRHLSSREVQSALGNFFADNPQILMPFFETLGKKFPAVKAVRQSPNPLLPQVTQAQKEAALAYLRKLGEDDLNEDMDSEYLIQMIKASRRNKECVPIFDE